MTQSYIVDDIFDGILTSTTLVECKTSGGCTDPGYSPGTSSHVAETLDEVSKIIKCRVTRASEGVQTNLGFGEINKAFRSLIIPARFLQIELGMASIRKYQQDAVAFGVYVEQQTEFEPGRWVVVRSASIIDDPLDPEPKYLARQQGSGTSADPYLLLLSFSYQTLDPGGELRESYTPNIAHLISHTLRSSGKQESTTPSQDVAKLNSLLAILRRLPSRLKLS